jgi:hypothetical protein
MPVQLRDAVEADAGRLADLTDTPRDVMRNLVHDRTVRVAERDDEIVGFVSFDARDRTVHVTQIEGTPDIYPGLLEEPLGFARTENMAVEMLVPEGEAAVEDAAVAAGFQEIGSGPRFDGRPTTRLRTESP